jgi:inner membrane protein
MDNLTHSLVGLLVGETAAAVATPAESGPVARGLPAAKKRNAILGLMLVGSNFPDFDLFYTALDGSKLGYMLHHRGYTHTIVGALLATALMLGMCEWWMRRQRLQPTAKDRLQLLGVALLAPLLHIAMDFTNNYGVHPFWPFYDAWLYGDSVFIIEPLLWSVAAPLALLFRSSWARYAIWLVLIAGAGLCLFSGLVPLLSGCVYLAVIAALLGVATQAPRTALFAGIGGWLLTTTVFMASSHIAGTRVDALAAREFPGFRTLDHVLTPLPVNPLCWDVLLVQRNATEEVVRRATLSLAPQWVRADRCTDGVASNQTTAKLRPVAAAAGPAIHWRGEVTTAIGLIQQLVETSCAAEGFMRFARAPFLYRGPIADAPFTLGDLRYDREAGAGFAELQVAPSPRPKRCSFMPPWLPPRGDLLVAIQLPADRGKE